MIVEQFLEGYDFRFLVIAGRFICAAQRVPAFVVGDGKRSIEELVAEVNKDPRRGIGHEKILTKIEIDDLSLALLARRNLTPRSVPEAGETVYLKSTANLSTGGISRDVTDSVHPSNIHLMERIARIVGLDIAGIDVISPSVEHPIAEVGGGIVEVNAAPGFRMHTDPTEGTPRDAAGAVIDMLYPPGTASRIPIVSVTGTNGKTTTTRLLAHVARYAGHHVGPDDDRGRLHRQRADHEGRLHRPVLGAGGAARPDRDLRGAGDGARRACCASASATTGPTSASSRTSPRTTWGCATSRRWKTWRG